MTDGSGDERRGAGGGRRERRSRRPAGAGAILLALAVVLAAAAPGVGHAQEGEGGPTLDLGGLLRTGFRAGPAEEDRRDQFEIFDARLNASGEIGIVFDYFVEAEFDDEDEELDLLDARLSLPIIPLLQLELGQFKAPFGREALQRKGDITFVERSQITQLVAPGRQVGLQLAGEALEGRLSYRGGVFNGSGRELENDDDSFLWAGRVSYNNLGTAAFLDELMVEVGANVAFSSDSAASLAGLAELPPGAFTVRDPRVDLGSFRGDRLLWGADLEATFRGFFLRGEYLRGEFEPEEDPVGAPELDDDVVAEGGYVEGGYNLWGAIEGVLRWDAMNDFLRRVDGQPVDDDDIPVDAVNPGAESHFLVFGLNLFPGRFTKLGLQYSVGVGGTDRGPGLGDGEFTLNAQVDF